MSLNRFSWPYQQWCGWRHRVRCLVVYPYQRLKYGVSDYDAGNFDVYLAKVLARGIQQVRHGDGYQPLNADYVPDWEQVNDPTYWHQMLDEMIEGFCLQATYWDWMNDVSPAIEAECNRKIQRAFDLLAQFHGGLWD